MTFYRDGNGDYVNDAVCCMSVSHFFLFVDSTEGTCQREWYACIL